MRRTRRLYLGMYLASGSAAAAALKVLVAASEGTSSSLLRY
jgi:hypothetical protein